MREEGMELDPNHEGIPVPRDHDPSEEQVFTTRFLCEACEDWYCVRCNDHLGDCFCIICFHCGETSDQESEACETCGETDGFWELEEQEEE